MLQPIKKRKKKNPNDEITQDWACSLQQTRQKASEQCTNEEDTADFYNTCCHSFTSLKLVLLVLQSLVSLHSLPLFRVKNVLVKSKTPVSLPWALLPLIGKNTILALTQPKVTKPLKKVQENFPASCNSKFYIPSCKNIIKNSKKRT